MCYTSIIAVVLRRCDNLFGNYMHNIDFRKGMSMEQKHDIVLYQIDDTNVCVSVIYKDETFWLTRMSMAELLDVGPQAISKHLGNIYKEEELDRESTSSKMELVQNEGGVEKKRNVDFYNLDAIIAVSYRVNSKKATKFRQWATKTLKVYMERRWQELYCNKCMFK